MNEGSIQLVRESDRRILISNVEVARTFWSRFKGLQCRREMPRSNGLWIYPCSSLHTCFMRFPIDVIMLDASQVVVGIRRNLQPWRVQLCPRSTRSVIETAVDVCEVLVGEQLRIEGLEYS